MMKKISALLLGAMMIFGLTACDMQYTQSELESTGGFGASVGGSSGSQGGSNDSSGDQTPDEQRRYTVTLIDANGDVYPKTEGMKAHWSNGYEFYSADIVNGVAEIVGLDGDYSVTLSGLDEDYSYNPNGNATSNFTPDIQIPVYRLTKARGKDGSDPYKSKTCRGLGVYRTELTSAEHVVYYEFEPTENGVYVVESWVNIASAEINPKIDVHAANFAFREYQYTLDEGGASKGYSRNFKYIINVDDSNIGSVWTFGIRADQKEGVYPVSVDFALMRDGGFTAQRYYADYIMPEGLYGLMADEIRALQKLSQEEFEQQGTGLSYQSVMAFTAADLKDAVSLHTAFGNYPAVETYAYNAVKNMFLSYQGSGSLIGPETNYTPAGSTVSVLAFRGENYQLSPVTGIYHKYSMEEYGDDPYGFGAGYGPMLFGYVTNPTRFIDTAFNMIEYKGNKNLTVEDGTENHKLFVEGYEHMSAQEIGMPINFPEACKGMYGYGDFANSNGLVPVTPELKVFFQKYSVAQRLFNDGNGWVETSASPMVDALEEDQWLFACCYYSNI